MSQETRVIFTSEDAKICNIADSNLLPEDFMGKPPHEAFDYLEDHGYQLAGDNKINEKPGGMSRIEWKFIFVGTEDPSELIIRRLSELTRDDASES